MRGQQTAFDEDETVVVCAVCEVPLEGLNHEDDPEAERFECPKCGEGAPYRELVEELERYIEASNDLGSESLPQSPPRFILR